MRQEQELSSVYSTGVAAVAKSEDRSAFITRTYLHVALAVLAFVALEALLFASGAADALAMTLFSSRGGMLVLMIGFVGVSWMADRWARSEQSVGMQYFGLGLYVVAEAIITLPLLWIAAQVAPGAIPAAGLVSIVLFGGLTGVVLITRADLSFMGGVLTVASFASLGVIVASVLFGFSLGLVFSGLMVALAGGYIVYFTSNVLHSYRTDQHVAAALALFSALGMMFWYVLRIFLGSRR